MTRVKMKKDGTEYLALVRFENDTEEWVILKWGKPAGLSDERGKEAWCARGFALKIKKIISYALLSDVVMSYLKWNYYCGNPRPC